MSVRSGQSITVEFVTSSFSTGAATNADSLPTGTLVVNGVDNAAVVTVTNVDTGRYKAAVTLPTLAFGDVVELSVAATVSTVAGKGIVWSDTKDIALDTSGRIDLGSILGTASAGVAGYMGLDWSHINAPTTAQALSGTTISTTQIVASVSGAVGSVTGGVGGSVTGNVGGSVGSIAAGGISNASYAADTGKVTVRSNTAQAGGATTITLDASASAVTNFYNNDLIYLTGGTGAGQARFITAYNGTTKVATVNSAWATNPDATTTFAIIPFDSIPGATAPTAAQVATAVWQDLTAGSDFGTAGSIGALLKTDIDAAISSRLATSGYTSPPTAASIATTVWQDLTAGADFGTAGSIGLLLKTDIDAAISSRGTGTALTATQVENAVWDGLTASHSTAGSFGLLVKTDLDAAISSRLASSSYTAAPTTAQIATAVWTDLLASSDFATASSIGALLKTDIDAAISSRLASGNVTVGGYAAGQDPATLVLDTAASGHNTAGTIGADINLVGTNLDAKISTRSAPGTAQTIDGTSALTESYAAAGAGFTLAQGLYEICQVMTEFAIAGTTITAKKRDKTTTAATYTLDSNTAPTSRTRAT